MHGPYTTYGHSGCGPAGLFPRYDRGPAAVQRGLCAVCFAYMCFVFFVWVVPAGVS